MGFDFHWFKLHLIAVVMLRVTHLCHVYSSCLSSFSVFSAYDTRDSVIRDDWICSTL